MSIGGGASLGSARGEIVLDVARAQANVKQLQGTINQFGATAGDSLSRVATGLGLLAAARGIGNIFGGAITGAANFEQAMDGVGSALGGVGDDAAVTVAQFEALNEEALRIGSTTSKSATEAAVAMDLMAKAGVGLEEILNGGAQAAVNLSEATGEGLAQSAQTMSSVLNLFEGIDPGRAADIITTGMNSSNATLSEFETGLARLAPVILATDLSLEDAAATIAYFNSQGFAAAEVGTSMTAAFNDLASPKTQEATDKIAELGLSVFDAKGEFVGFPAIMDQLNTATAGMTKEQKNAALSVIFTADSMDLMTLSANKGGDGLREVEDAADATGTAAKAAAERMDNFKGSLEELRGAVETLAIRIGTIFLPALRAIVDIGTAVVGAFARLPAPLLALAGGATVAAAAMAGIAGVMVLAGPRMAEFRVALLAVRAAMIGLLIGNPIILGLAATIALFGLAYKTNFGGFADFVDEKVGFVQRRFGYFTKGFSRTSKNLDRVFKNMSGSEVFFKSLGVGLRDALGIQGKAGDAFVQTFNKIGRVSNDFVGGIGRMTGALGDISRIIQRDGIAEGIDRLFGDKGQDLLRGFGEAAGTLPKVFGLVLGSIKTGIGPIDSILANAGAGFEQLGRSVELLFAGDFSQAGETLGNAVDRFLAVGDTVFDTAVDVIVSIGEFILGAAPDLFQWVQNKVFELFGGDRGGYIIMGDTVGQKDIAIKEVGVQIQSWLVGLANDAVSIYDAIKDWVSGKTGGLGANTSGIGAGGSFSGGGLPITGVGLSVVSWAVDAAVRVYDAIKDWVSGHTGGLGANTSGIGAGGSFSGGGLPITGVGLNIVNFLVTSAKTVGAAISDFVLGKSGQTDSRSGQQLGGSSGALESLQNVAISIGSWLVDQLTPLADEVMTFVTDTAWPAVNEALGTAWEATVSIGTWIADEAQAGTLVTSVQDKVDALLGGEDNVFTLDDLKFKIGTIGSGDITVDAGAILSSVWNAISAAVAYTPEFDSGTSADAEALGSRLGQSAIDLLVKGVSNAFSGGDTKDAPLYTDEVRNLLGLSTKAPTEDLGTVIDGFVKGLFLGAFDGVDALVTTYIDEPIREFQTKIEGKFDEFVTGISDAFTGGGTVDNRSGQTLGGTDPGSVISTAIGKLFDFELPTIDLPDVGELIGSVKTWFDGLVTSITGLFGGGDSGTVDNRSGQTLGGGGGIRAAIGKLFDFDLPEITLPDFGPLVTKVMGAIGTAFSTATGAGRDILVAIAQMLIPGEGDFASEGTSISGAIFDGIKAAITPAKGFEVLLAIAQSLATKAGDFASEGAEIASGIWEGIKDWFADKDIKDVLPDLNPFNNDEEKPTTQPPPLDGAGGLGGSGKRHGMPSIGEITEIGRGVGLAGGQGIASGFTDAGPEVQRRVTALFTAGNDEASSSGRFKGALLGAGIAAGITSAMPTIQANIGAALNAANSGGGPAPPPEGGPPKLAAAPVAPPPVVFPAPDLTLYAAGIATAVTALQTAVGVLGLVASGLAAPLGAAATAATNAFNLALGDGFRAGAEVARLGSSAIGDAIAVPDQYSKGASVGASLGAGLRDGMDSMLDAVRASAANLVGAAEAAAATKAEKGSPSRLFAREIGVPIGQGVAVGISSTTGLVNASLSSLIGGLASQSVPTSQMLGRQSTARASAGGGGGNVYVFALKSDEWVDMVRKNERGASAANYVDELHGAFAGMMGG